MHHQEKHLARTLINKAVMFIQSQVYKWKMKTEKMGH